jgi:hypothetical protein
MPAAAMLHAPEAHVHVDAVGGVHCPLKAPNALLADFIQFYAQRSAERGDTVDVQVMRGIARDFLQNHPLTTLSFHECRRLLNEAEGRSLPPFERIVTEPLRPLFPHFGSTPGPVVPSTYPMLSRRVIPGLICAISAMLGQDRTDAYRRQAEDLVAAHLNPMTGDPLWSEVFADPEAQAMMIDINLAMIGHFMDFERRLGWLVAMVDAHTAPSHDVHDQDWQFSERHAVAMLLAETQTLRTAMSDYGEGGPASRHGPQLVETATRFFAALDAAAQRVGVSV